MTFVCRMYFYEQTVAYRDRFPGAAQEHVPAMHDTGLLGDVREAYERLIPDAMPGACPSRCGFLLSI